MHAHMPTEKWPVQISLIYSTPSTDLAPNWTNAHSPSCVREMQKRPYAAEKFKHEVHYNRGLQANSMFEREKRRIYLLLLRELLYTHKSIIHPKDNHNLWFTRHLVSHNHSFFNFSDLSLIIFWLHSDLKCVR